MKRNTHGLPGKVTNKKLSRLEFSKIKCTDQPWERLHLRQMRTGLTYVFAKVLK